MVSSDEINKIGIVLNDPTRPLKERFRALFTLKNIGGDESVVWISKAFEDKSALLKHEVAYCLGQGHLQLSFFRYD
jgi:deoxyhypusine monooxygenase